MLLEGMLWFGFNFNSEHTNTTIDDDGDDELFCCDNKSNDDDDNSSHCMMDITGSSDSSTTAGTTPTSRNNNNAGTDDDFTNENTTVPHDPDSLYRMLSAHTLCHILEYLEDVADLANFAVATNTKRRGIKPAAVLTTEPSWVRDPREETEPIRNSIMETW